MMTIIRLWLGHTGQNLSSYLSKFGFWGHHLEADLLTRKRQGVEDL